MAVSRTQRDFHLEQQAADWFPELEGKLIPPGVVLAWITSAQFTPDGDEDDGPVVCALSLQALIRRLAELHSM